MKVICNKAKGCISEYCSHKVGHKKGKRCKGMCYFKIEGNQIYKCIPVSEPKREVIEVTKCVNCPVRNVYDGMLCNKYDKCLTANNIVIQKPDYCEVTRIIVEMEESK